jgi:ABC-type transport system substrate-binding protein
LIPEVSTTVAGLKNKEIDLAQVSLEQMEDLKSAGVAVEVTQHGGSVLLVRWGGMVIAADKRYNVDIHNKDPWADPRVRKAMSFAIDRQAICKAIYAGYAFPASVPIYSLTMDKYQYPYDPAAAKQLLKEAGYPNGFSFRAISYTFPGTPETGRIMEALAGYWQQIGLKPEISIINYATYYSKNSVPCKTAGDISIISMGVTAEMLTKAENFFFPNATDVVFQDEGSYTIYKDNPKATMEERLALVDKLNQYYFNNVGPLPVVKVGFCYAWNSEKILPWPHYDSTAPEYYEYVRHVQPLNTFRLFDPVPGR